MSSCTTCNFENICVYEYKPTDCINLRKFKPNENTVVCDECKNTGYKPYPIKCSKCNGSGAIVKK